MADDFNLFLKQVADAVNTLHDPDAPRQEGHVYRLWSDGELTTQKGGSLLGQRIEHVIALGWRTWHETEMPAPQIVLASGMNKNGNSYVWVARHHESSYGDNELTRAMRMLKAMTPTNQ